MRLGYIDWERAEVVCVLKQIVVVFPPIGHISVCQEAKVKWVLRKIVGLCLPYSTPLPCHVFEKYLKKIKGNVSLCPRKTILCSKEVKRAIPLPGVCIPVYSANTCSLAMETRTASVSRLLPLSSQLIVEEEKGGVAKKDDRK